jgi:hypothetical protein
MKLLLVGIGSYLCKVYNYHDCRACGYKRSGILFWLDGMVWMGMDWFWSSLCGCRMIYRTPLWIILWKLIQHNWVVLAYSYNIEDRCQYFEEVKFKCFSAYNLILYLPWCYPCISHFSCTCWVPTICILNLAIFPCYSILLLRRRRWTRILRGGVLGYVLPQLPFLWCHGVFHYSASLESRLSL